MAGFYWPGLEKNVDPSAHITLARTQSMTTLNSQKPGNGSNSMPRRKRVWGFGEHQVRETALKSGKLCTRLRSFKAEGRKEPSCLRNLPFVRMTLDISVSASCSPSSPQY